MSPVFAQFVDSTVIPLATTTLLALASAAGAWGVKYLRERWNINISDAQQQQLIGYVDHGIAFAEERAKAYTKGQTDSSTLHPATKLAYARDFVIDQLGQVPTAELQAKVNDLIHARLGGLSGVGATGAAAVQVPSTA